jgi:hypothetical protein
MKLEFHHIKVVSDDVDRLHYLHINVVGLDGVPIQSFSAYPIHG